jgi:hypothetical protein
MSAEDHRPVPFFVGVPRSGTTLLRLMLDAHPAMAIPPETYFVPNLIEACDGGAGPEQAHALMTTHRRWGDLGIDGDALLERLRAAPQPLSGGDAVRAVFELYAERRGKQRWGDKTPAYLTSIGEISSALPEARFVHIIRDGRDVALSVLAMPDADRPMRAPKTAAEVAARWRKRIERAREQSAGLPGYVEVSYEDLVTNPEPQLRRVCELIDLDLDPAMLAHQKSADEGLAEMDRDLPASDALPEQSAEARLAPHRLANRPPTGARIGRWRTEMDSADVAAFEEEAGELLAQLGYETTVSAGGTR